MVNELSHELLEDMEGNIGEFEKAVARAEKLGEAAQGDDNLMYPIIDAVREYATEQEICDVFRTVFGAYRDPGVY